MRCIDPQDYGAALRPLLAAERLNPLGPGEPDAAARPLLERLGVDRAFPEPVADRKMAEACVAGLWLYHNFGEACHRIVQEIATPTGAFWHGIFHRREPDASNSKYWFRRAGRHPVFAPLLEAVRAEAGKHPEAEATAEALAGQAQWDPLRFVDLCDAARDEDSAAERLCRVVQQVEWELLFDYCYRAALGRESAGGRP